MKLKCQGKCLKALNKITKTTLSTLINDFMVGIDAIYNNPEILQQFYDYIQMKYAIPCEVGMLFVEKITVENLFEKYRDSVENMNKLTNDKMKLYRWIKPAHLEINSYSLIHVISSFSKIQKTSVPSVKVLFLMEGIAKLYKIIGKHLGLDVFFPYLVYCLLKSEIPDLYAHIHFIKIFRRNFFQDCLLNCNHGFQVTISCGCLISHDWGREEEYYLTTAIAAVDFISKIEYYNLKIEKEEFESEIVDALKKLKF